MVNMNTTNKLMMPTISQPMSIVLPSEKQPAFPPRFTAVFAANTAGTFRFRNATVNPCGFLPVLHAGLDVR